MLALFLSQPIIFHLQKTEATFPPSLSTHHQHLSPNFFSCSLYSGILDENHLKSNETKLKSASQKKEKDQ